MKKYETLSYCGIYCGGCKNFKQNMNCSGCQYEENLIDDCPTRSCAIERNLLYCGECKIFPCKMLKDYYNDGVSHHELAFKNMKKIKNVGIEKWLKDQKEKHTCQCGNRTYWFQSKCSECINK